MYRGFVERDSATFLPVTLPVSSDVSVCLGVKPARVFRLAYRSFDSVRNRIKDFDIWMRNLPQEVSDFKFVILPSSPVESAL